MKDAGAREPFAAVVSRRYIRRTATAWILAFMQTGASVGVTGFIPTILVAQGFTIVHSLGYSTVINIGGIVGAAIAAVLARYVDRRYMFIGAAVLGLVAALLFAESRSAGLILVFGFILQCMFIGGITTRWMYLPELYPTSIRTFGTGTTWMAALVGAAVLPLLLGYVFKAYGGPGVLTVAAVMLAIIAVSIALLGTETRGRRLEALAAS